MNYEAVTLGYAVDPEHPDPTPIEDFHGHVARKLMSTLSARLVHEVERQIVEYQFYEDIFLMDEDDVGLSGWSDDQMWFGFTGETAGIGEHWFTSIASLERWALGAFFTENGYTLTSVPDAPPLHDNEWVRVPISGGAEMVAFWTDRPLHDPYPLSTRGEPTLADLSAQELDLARRAVNAKQCMCSMCVQRAALVRFGEDRDGLRDQASRLVEAWFEASQRVDTSHQITLLPDNGPAARRQGDWVDATVSEERHDELLFSPNGARLFGWERGAKAINVWDVASGGILDTSTFERELLSACWLDDATIFIVGEACTWRWRIHQGTLEIVSDTIPPSLYTSTYLGHGLVISSDPNDYSALELFDMHSEVSILSPTEDELETPCLVSGLIDVHAPFDQIAPAFWEDRDDLWFFYLPTLDLHPTTISQPGTTSIAARDGVLAWVNGAVDFVRPHQPVRRLGITNPQDEPTRCVIGPHGHLMTTFHALSHDTLKNLGAVIVWDIRSNPPMPTARCVETWSDGRDDLSEVVALSPCARRVAWSNADGLHVRSLL